MRSNLFASSRSPYKISVRQLEANRQFNSSVSPTYYPIEEQRTFQYPPSHIESETSNSEPILKLSGIALGETRERRRKIFQKKVLRGTVVSPQKKLYHTHASPSYEQKLENSRNINDSGPQVYPYQSRNNSNLYDNFVTMKQIGQANNNSRQNTQKSHHSRDPQSKTVNSIKINQENTRFHSDSLHQNERNRNYGQIKNQSNQKLPSFARPHEQNVETHKSSFIEQETLMLLSGMPEQVRKIRNEMFTQKQEITELQERINKKQEANHQRQRQLLKKLIGKQDELTRKQSQLNESLQKINKVQTQSNHRYEQLLKYELELQQAKRIEQLTNYNEKLYQQLLRNQTKDTVDLTPFTHPVNNTTAVNQYFKDDDNWREISALENQRYFQCFDNSNDDHNNTIRQLLSPLEILPDYGL